MGQASMRGQEAAWGGHRVQWGVSISLQGDAGPIGPKGYRGDEGPQGLEVSSPRQPHLGAPTPLTFTHGCVSLGLGTCDF